MAYQNRYDLPTGLPPRANIPAHIVQDGRNTSSTGSNDSVMTQVPMSYHLSGEQQYAYSNASSQGEDAWSAQSFPAQSGGFDGFGGPGSYSNSKTLNPHSSPYVPGSRVRPNPGFTNQRFEQSQQQHPQFQQLYRPDGYNQGSSYQRQEMGPHKIDNANYGGYGQQQNMAVGGPVGGQNSQFPNPYGFQGQGGFQQLSNPSPYNSFTTSDSNSSSAMSHASTNASQPQGYHNFAYRQQDQYINGQNFQAVQPSDRFRGPDGTGGAGSTGGPRSASGGYNSGAATGFSSSFQNNHQQHHRSAQRQRSISDLSGYVRLSNLGSEPVRNYSSYNSQTPTQNNTSAYGKSYTVQQNNYQTPGFGGPVQQPASAFRTGSPTKSVSRGSTRASSVAPNSRDSDGSTSLVGSRTAQSPLDRSFRSEPHNNDSRKQGENTDATPRLRSRAGQSMVGLKGHARSDSAGSARRDGGEFFTEPSLLEQFGKDENQTPSKRMAMGPPKMLSLLTGGDNGGSSLSPIGEITAYNAAQARPRQPFDSFGPQTAALTPYVPGNSLSQQQQMSRALNMLTSNGTRRPSIDEALDPKYFPFIEYCRMPTPDTWGVIKIKNIPYGVNRSEVMAFLGRNARIIDEKDYEPVHIVMERVTSKTLDCYVEFINLNEAVSAVNRFETNRTGGRGGRLGQRHVEVELSSQEVLMKDLFPKAKNVHWVGGRPVITPKDPNDKYNSGFQGFVSKEELVMLSKHVEAPQRVKLPTTPLPDAQLTRSQSPFSKDCPQRPFECLISTLLKYPWYMVDYITIEDRILLFETTMKLLVLLVERVNNEKDNVNLTVMLLKRVWRAALRCPGFTPAQKDDVVIICGLDPVAVADLGVAPHAPHWKDLWTIGPKPNVPIDLLLWYCAIIREATVEKRDHLTLADRSARGEDKVTAPKLFGDLKKYIHYNKEQDLLYQTSAQVAKAEWTAIEQVLRQALTPALGA
ncbi:hypothetical protein LSUE1_G004001 [Lachnellula suecica]|uniref:RRM domain-containing protein n=1 Tax=Lachnellula suecica TaxID=602035 RepID=A0A8T9CEL6_9HELO|nr:hypothetical protein LSUE1_G004001 [Lachnellula suecica]